MSRLQVRRTMKRGLKQLLTALDLYESPAPSPPEPVPPPLPQPTPSPGDGDWGTPEQDWKAQFEQALAELEEEESLDDVADAPIPSPNETGAGPSTDGALPALTVDEVQSVLDEMVRPALQADGGDITLVKVENNDVYVALVGACQSCPSSIMTMKMGVEQLLHDTFPQMGALIQVGAGAPSY